jgi:hypothetical protein
MMLLRMAVSQTRHFPYERKVRVPSRKKRGRRKMLAEYAPGPSASHRPRIARHADPSAMRLRSEEELKGGLDHALKEHSAGDAGRRLVGPFLLSIAPRAMALASRCGRAHARLEMAPRRRGRAFNAGPRAISTRPTLAIGKGESEAPVNQFSGRTLSLERRCRPLYGAISPTAPFDTPHGAPLSENSRCRRCLWPASPPHPSV